MFLQWAVSVFEAYMTPARAAVPAHFVRDNDPVTEAHHMRFGGYGLCHESDAAAR